MRVYQLDRAQVVHRPVEDVFRFFADARNLEDITPPWLRFELVTREPIEMSVGTLIEYRLRLHGIPLRWVSRIDVWEAGCRFVDRQVRGPYRLWEHLHTVEPHPEGTLSSDHVRYALPLGVLGVAIHRAVVERDLRRIFDHRRQAVTRLLGGAVTSGHDPR